MNNLRRNYGSTFDIHTNLIADPEGNKVRSVEWHLLIKIIIKGKLIIKEGFQNAKSNHAWYVAVSRAVDAPSGRRADPGGGRSRADVFIV